MIYKILIISIIILLSWKWIMLIVYIPIIRKINKKNLYRREDEIKQLSHPSKTCKIKKHIKKLIPAILYGNTFIRYIDFHIAMIPSFILRIFIYKHIFLVHNFGAEIRAHSRLKIGKGTIIGDKVLLDARNGIIIGKNVNFSSNVHIYTEQHDHRDPNFACNSTIKFRVQIDDRVWIGPNTLILPKVHIGEGEVVARGAVVTKDVPPYAIVAGVPASIIGERNHNFNYDFSGKGNIY